MTDKVTSCRFELIGDALDLINRQKAEIEGLRSTLDVVNHTISHFKAEAYKEFAKELKEHMCSYDLDNYHSFQAVEEDVIDDLLKEMVGE